MTDLEMREKSKKKFEQIHALMKGLNVTCEAKQVIRNNVIEMAVIWNDHEKYPADPVKPKQEQPSESSTTEKGPEDGK